MNDRSEILKEIASYYTDKVKEHGDTPQGVDWNGVESQTLRFEQISKIIGSEVFTINDLGCGYGAYYEYLKHAYDSFEYYGYDISDAMIERAKAKFQDDEQAHFSISPEPNHLSDYTVASGIFNVRLEHGSESWYQFITEILDVMDNSSVKGFAFNCLTSYSDEGKKRDYLYYTDPCKIFDLCKKRYSRNVTLLHDYDLYEFTMLVRK